MAYNEINIGWLEQVIVPAIDMFYANTSDRDLVIRNAAERAIVANIYCKMNNLLMNLQEQNNTLRRLNLDIEYNRNYLEPKFVYEKCELCNARNCINNRNSPRTSASPDILIHHRMYNDDNQIAIEFKKKSNRGITGRNNDQKKLTYLTCHKPFPDHEPQNYIFRYGLFIDLGVNDYNVTSYIDTRPQPIRHRQGGQWI